MCRECVSVYVREREGESGGVGEEETVKGTRRCAHTRTYKYIYMVCVYMYIYVDIRMLYTCVLGTSRRQVPLWGGYD